MYIKSNTPQPKKKIEISIYAMPSVFLRVSPCASLHRPPPTGSNFLQPNVSAASRSAIDKDHVPCQAGANLRLNSSTRPQSRTDPAHPPLQLQAVLTGTVRYW